MVKKVTRLRDKAARAAKAGPSTPSSAAPADTTAPPPPSHIRSKIVKRLQFFDRVSSAARKESGVTKPVAASAATTKKTPPSTIAALLARPLGTTRLVKGTRLGLSPSALRRAKRKAKATGALGSLRDLGRLTDAVEEAAAARAAGGAAAPPTPNFSRGRVRMAVGAAETSRLTSVVAHPAFLADPIAAIGAHLASVAPPVAEGRGRPVIGAGGAAVSLERAKQQRIRRKREAKASGRKREAMALD